MKAKFKNYLAFPLLLIITMFFFWIWPSGNASITGNNDDAEMMMGEISEIVDENGEMQTLAVKINKGSFKDKTIPIENDDTMLVESRIFDVGDKVMVAYSKMTYGLENFYIAEYDRTATIYWLFGLFILVVLLVASWQGIGSIIGMFFSFLVLFKFVLPRILEGADPLGTAILGSMIIIPATFYSSHGFERKTTVAVVGTVLTLIITGFLATFFANWGHLSGLASEEASFLKLDTAQNINFKGLVLAGMIISILGILDDITISQASVIQQLKNVKEKISFTELFSRAMKVGHDHIASMVNTLILVYTGASLPLLLLFMDRSKQFSEVMNYEFLSEEIIRTLVGSIGLILAVPITTLLAAIVLSKSSSKEKHHHHHHHH